MMPLGFLLLGNFRGHRVSVKLQGGTRGRCRPVAVHIRAIVLVSGNVGPPVVLSRPNEVHLVVSARAVLGRVDLTVQAKRNPLNVPVTVRINVTAHSGNHGIVGRDRSIEIHSQQLTLILQPVPFRDFRGRGDLLCTVRDAIVPSEVASSIADAQIQLSIWTKCQAARDVIVVDRQTGEKIDRAFQRLGRRVIRVPPDHSATEHLRRAIHGVRQVHVNVVGAGAPQ